MKKLLYIGIILMLASCGADATEIATSNQPDGTDTTEPSSGFIDERDGKFYKTVKIGEQVWMAENLAYRANSGTYWDCKELNCDKAPGYLYDWQTANNVCPTGWHLPDEEEWAVLMNNLGDNVGLKMKSKSGWCVNEDGIDGNGTNESGFNALPAGYYLLGNMRILKDYNTPKSGVCIHCNSMAKWWSSSFTEEYGEKMAWTYTLNCLDIEYMDQGEFKAGKKQKVWSSDYLKKEKSPTTKGRSPASVRCIKDNSKPESSGSTRPGYVPDVIKTLRNETYGDYPQTSNRYLNENDLKGLSKKELQIMRNEIYARHGRKFKSESMKNYFNAQPWYTPLYENVKEKLTNIEKHNIKIIKQFE